MKILTEFLGGADRPLVVILGPTGSGKTAFSLRVAEELAAKGGRHAEVVNADSRQLYRFLNIGTAKISAEEMGGIPHHLLDVLDPKQEATAGWYQREASKKIDDILERGNISMLVGGSMLYISTITDGLSLVEASDPIHRDRLMQEYEKDAGASLHERLSIIDPETAERVHPRNKSHLIRALEIFEVLKQPKSDVVPRSELRSTVSRSRYDLCIFGMKRSREELVSRINDRVREMFQNGWVEEVSDLQATGYTAEDPGIESHGYREIMLYLSEGIPSEITELQKVIAAKSRQYAKRQMTWWNGDTRIHWVKPTS